MGGFEHRDHLANAASDGSLHEAATRAVHQQGRVPGPHACVSMAAKCHASGSDADGAGSLRDARERSSWPWICDGERGKGQESSTLHCALPWWERCGGWASWCSTGGSEACQGEARARQPRAHRRVRGTGSRCYVARAAAAEWLGSTRCGSLGPHGRAVLWRGRGGRGALGGCGGVPGRSALARVPLRGALLAVGRRRRGDGARRDCLRRAQREPRGARGRPGADAAGAGARPRGERSWRALGRGARDGGGGRGARALRARGGVDGRERVPGADARDGAVLRGAARGRRRALHRRGAPCRRGGGPRPTRRARL